VHNFIELENVFLDPSLPDRATKLENW